MRIVSVAAVAAFLLTGMSSGVAHAESAPGCGPVTQIGSTAHIKWSDTNIYASVKQFKGCGKNWAYVYVWDSYHAEGHDYYVTAAVLTSSGSHGYQKGRNRQKELWSSGTNTLTVCTQAMGHLVDNPEFAHSAKTGRRC